MTKRLPPMFEFKFPQLLPPRPPFIQVVYEDEPLAPVPFEMATQYSRFMKESTAFSTPTAPDLFIITLPTDATVTMKSVQAVIEALANGRTKIPMDDRLGVLRAARSLEVDLLRKALEEHLDKGCRSRPILKLQCLEEVFELPQDDEFRRQRFDDARENFYPITNLTAWTKLSADVVRELLSDDERLKVKERDLYLSVLRWLVSNPLEIPVQSDRLLRMVRFGSMSTEDKFKCLEEARTVGLSEFVKPYLIEANWYRTCHELNHPEFTDLVEYDRLSHFIAENRRTLAIDLHAPVPCWKKSQSDVVVTIDTKPSALERVMEGKMEPGAWMPRPRAASADVLEKGSISTRSLNARASRRGMSMTQWRGRYPGAG